MYHLHCKCTILLALGKVEHNVTSHHSANSLPSLISPHSANGLSTFSGFSHNFFCLLVDHLLSTGNPSKLGAQKINGS